MRNCWGFCWNNILKNKIGNPTSGESGKADYHFNWLFEAFKAECALDNLFTPCNHNNVLGISFLNFHVLFFWLLLPFLKPSSAVRYSFCLRQTWNWQSSWKMAFEALRSWIWNWNRQLPIGGKLLTHVTFVTDRTKGLCCCFNCWLTVIPLKFDIVSFWNTKEVNVKYFLDHGIRDFQDVMAFLTS